jgi:hypothetical protein
MRLWLQIHGLRYQTQASVQVNNSGWMPINDSTVTLLGQGGVWGGIGGGFHTLQMALNLPAGTVTTGTNTVSFQFNGTDGKVSGFRVLSFDFLGPDGTRILAPQTFVWDDPNTWQAPSTLASDIAAGKSLWYTAALTAPTPTGPASIRANCSSCHAQDGRDLKYFNYSNNSIRTRSMFHGLTAQQGDQIASYIRSLSAPNPGRPWNPPYQPGPGTDAKPISEWAAGAGLNAVLDHDADMVPYLMPGGSTANWSANAHLNVREIPVDLQLPDWNHWLPTVAPVDGWGDAFTTSSLYTEYLNIRSQLQPGDPVAYQSVLSNMHLWFSRMNDFQINTMLANQKLTNPLWQDPTYLSKVYSVSLWNAVKSWELNQEFGLEPMSRVAFGPQAWDRAWNSNMLFSVSPFMSGMPRPSAVIGNGSVVAHQYFSFVWYQLQLILNDGNGLAQGTDPIDWAYALGYPVNDLTWDALRSQPRVGTGALLIMWLTKALQSGFSAGGVNDTNPNRLVVFPGQVSTWSEMPVSLKLQLMNAWISTWLNRFQPVPLQQLIATGQASATVNFTQLNNLETDLAQALPELRYQGVDVNLLQQLATWGSSLWTGYDWSGALNAPCSVYNLGHVVCATPGQVF